MSTSIVDEYQRQLRILDALRNESQAVRSRFDAARQQYAQQIGQSRNLGYMGDYVDQLNQRHREFSGHLDELLQTLVLGENMIAEQEDRLQRLILDAMDTD